MTAETILSAPRTAGNENKTFIKATAYLFMLIDHLGAAFFPQVRVMRVLGRIAFPLFAWGLCTGAEYTRNIWKYCLRLLIVGLISQPFYVYGMNHAWTDLNVFATLLLGLLGIALIRENRFGSRVWGPVLVVLAACAANTETNYGFRGVMLILFLYGARKTRSGLVSMMLAFCLYWGYGHYSLKDVLGIPLPDHISFLPYADRLLADISRIQFWAVLSLPLIAWPMRTGGNGLRLPNWLGYAVYPVHLGIFALIRHWNEIMTFFSQWL